MKFQVFKNLTHLFNGSKAYSKISQGIHIFLDGYFVYIFTEKSKMRLEYTFQTFINFKNSCIQFSIVFSTVLITNEKNVYYFIFGHVKILLLIG